MNLSVSPEGSPFFSGSNFLSVYSQSPLPSLSPVSTFESSEEDNPISHQQLPISSEYDMAMENFFEKDGVDRSEWNKRLLQENPDIKDFIDRVDPVARATNFARMYLPSNRLVSQDLLLTLISQHLRTLGLIETQSSLHDEWSSLVQIPTHLLHSQLALIIQRGITKAERFWELSMPSVIQPENPAKLLDEEISNTIGGTPYVVEDDTPLSSEDFGDPAFFKTANGHPIEASLNQIIWLLTLESEYNGSALIPAICLTYKSFTTPKIFFTKLRERFRLAFEENETKRGHSIMLTFKLLKAWLRDGQNTIDQPVLEAARNFVETELKPQFPNYCSNLFVQSKRHHFMDYSRAPKVVLGNCRNIWQKDFSIFDIPPIEIARQLTILTCQYYYDISRIELLDNAWNIPRFKHRAPNVCALYLRTNKISSWVQTTILTEPSLQKRLWKMRFLLEVMSELERIRNYFDSFAIFGGFNANPTFRLDVHKELLPEDLRGLLTKAQETYAPGDNFAYARKMQDEALASKQPSLPIFSILLGDIALYNENTAVFSNGLINLKKCERMLKLIQAVEDFKKWKYSFLPIDQVLNKLKELDGLDEDSLMELSFDVEPANATPAMLKDVTQQNDLVRSTSVRHLD
ncbi:RasGEF domain containing protein [Histomonas meleagridis]|uniref:RasGEF domain containing protein n=1 Tax=Histomonas meleagridis TaxID=135588 RepID=UPI00355954A4|nr:RasGEF domain containing protein [Histomonas meleagridis]KAH0806726.1 RasGEF domain containing protein [Histomonas meleagridis]